MRKLLPLVGVLILIGLFLSWWFLPSNVLKRRVGKLFDTAQVPVTMSDLGRTSRGPNVAEFLADYVEVGPPDGFDDRVGEGYSRDDAAAFYSGAARYCRQISFLEPEFTTVEIDGDQGQVSLRIDTIVELPTNRPADGILVMDLDWKKGESGWRLERLSWHEEPR